MMNPIIKKPRYTFILALNPLASAFPAIYCGVSECMGNIIIPCGSKLSVVNYGELQFIIYLTLLYSN
jgi:hypothetical protein